MKKEMTTEEYQNFLDTIDTLPKDKREIIRRGVLQLNDDKKQLFNVIDGMREKLSLLNEMNERKL